MATQTCYPGTVVNESFYGIEWQNLNNAKTNDGTFTTADVSIYDYSEYLVCSNYGFAIPTGATINSILVTIKAKGEVSDNLTMFDNYLNYSGGFVNYALFQDTVVTTINTEYESATDYLSDPLWGRTWTPAEINNSAFSFYIAVGNANSETPELFYIDYISITVDYTETGGSSAIKSVNGLVKASVKSFNGLAIASVKSINGLE